ncbi:MAG: ammonium transporter [Butyricicoccus sp.]
MNAADTLFVILCAAMVLFMTPALSAFYAGLTRRKSGVDIMMQVWICLAVVGLLWIVCGFSLAFGSDTAGGLIGGGDYLMLRQVGIEPNENYGSTIPFVAFFFLQVTYAIITPALICGAVAERMTLKSYTLFVLLWSLIVYIPLAHMTWGGGLFSRLGLIDWSGGVVIHASAGFSALAAALVLKKRKVQNNTPHNMAQVSINCGVLLFGWLAFNAASALCVNENAVYSMVNSLIGSMVGMAVWLILTGIREKRPSFLTAMIGFLGGLVAVTPAAGVINTTGALVLSLIVSVVCWVCINVVHPTVGFDDTLDVWGLHGMGGFSGIILLPLFTDSSLITMEHTVGQQILVQAGCAIATAVFAFAATWIILKVIGLITPLRLPDDVEGNVDEMVYQEVMYD